MNDARPRGIRVILLWGIVSSVVSLASAQGANQVQSGESMAQPLTITLQDALARARVNEPQFRAAVTQYGTAKENTVQSRAALLPNVSTRVRSAQQPRRSISSISRRNYNGVGRSRTQTPSRRSSNFSNSSARCRMLSWRWSAAGWNWQ